MRLRPAILDDAGAIAALYGWYVEHGAVTFEEVPPTPDEMAARIAPPGLWLVAEADGRLLGYAYAKPFHARAAYRWTCETSIYLAHDARGQGVGGRLYAALLERVTAAGFVTAMALITEPNPESTNFHERFGFARVGLARGVGYKQGRWHDVGYWQRDLASRAVPPVEPRLA
ncbi:GNAT family N-acetyltransferase [Sphingomonas jatrophae]|uniref:Phosphinothricin acetyltransferase n=1 Tax=Sphingomonas jatrophae TaxID=1166337 RepID=A0A1I6LJ53_9SPHN|nr:GNAT family N-acetyltransferase [Sphingomonas jatrophae]SFS03372.1 phosphinothricin acetyltransferase [Sphingomonas jatrophae]